MCVCVCVCVCVEREKFNKMVIQAEGEIYCGTKSTLQGFGSLKRSSGLKVMILAMLSQKWIFINNIIPPRTWW